MQQDTRRQVTWVLIISAIAAIAMVASYRRSEMKRLTDAIANGTPEQRVEAVRTLVSKQKLKEALEDQPRWVQDNAVQAVALIGTEDAYYELLTVHAGLDAPAQTRDQTILTRLSKAGVEIFVEAVQDKDATTRGTALPPLKTIAAALDKDPQCPYNPALQECMLLLDAWDQYVRDNVRDVLAAIASDHVTRRLLPVLKLAEPDRKALPDGTNRKRTSEELLRAKGTAEAALTAMKVPALAPIIKGLLSWSDPEVRGNACKILGNIANQTVTGPIGAADAVTVVKPLLDRLDHDAQWGVRRRAATALGVLADVAKQNGVVPELIGHLADRSSEVKAACAESLGRIGDIAALVPLVDTLIANRAGAERELRIALTALGLPAITQISRALVSPEAEVRFIATQALAQIGSDESVVPLASMLKDPNLATRRVASDALRALADDRVLTQVAAALSDADWQVYHAARDALAHVGERAVPVLIQALGEPNPRVASMAEQALAQIGAKAVGGLVAALRSPSPPQVHWAAIALGDAGDAAVKPAEAALADRSQPVTARVGAAVALGAMRAPDAVAPLMAALKYQEPPVQIAAAQALQRIGDDRATPALVAALQARSVEVRDTALEVLRNWRQGKVDEHLAKVAATGDVNARRRAVILIAEHTSVAANELLNDVGPLTGEDTGRAKVDVKTLEQTAVDRREAPNLRGLAIEAVGYAGDDSSIQPLLDLLKPGNVYAAPAAVAVARIGRRAGPTAGEAAGQAGARKPLGAAATTLIDLLLATPDRDLRLKIVAGLPLMGDRPVRELIGRFEKSTPDLRPWIVAALAAIGKPATQTLLEVRGSSRDPELKQWLATTLSLIGDAQAQDLLKHLPTDEQPPGDKVQPSEAILRQVRLVGTL